MEPNRTKPVLACQCPCAQRKVHEDMPCRGWSGGNRLSCVKPFNPTEHIPLLEMFSTIPEELYFTYNLCWKTNWNPVEFKYPYSMGKKWINIEMILWWIINLPDAIILLCRFKNRIKLIFFVYKVFCYEQNYIIRISKMFTTWPERKRMSVKELASLNKAMAPGFQDNY